MKYQFDRSRKILLFEKGPSLHIDVECKGLVEPILEYKFPFKSFRFKTEVNFLFENLQILNIETMSNYNYQKIVLGGEDRKSIQVLLPTNSNKLNREQKISGVITKYANNDMPVLNAILLGNEFSYSTSL